MGKNVQELSLIKVVMIDKNDFVRKSDEADMINWKTLQLIQRIFFITMVKQT